jgi:hypothetical protein
MRGNCHFRQADLLRAVRAIEAAGKTVTRVEVLPNGKLVIVTGKPGENEAETENPWDRVLKNVEKT